MPGRTLRDPEILAAAIRTFRLTNIHVCEYISLVDLIQIYQCLCEPNRLRMINLLTRGPLCVCHFQDILSLPQAKVSQHLAYLRKRRMVEAVRQANWMIYSLPSRRSKELEANLKCLQDCVSSDKRFRADLAKLSRLKACSTWEDSPANQGPTLSCCL